MDVDNQKASLEALLQEHNLEREIPSAISPKLQHSSMLSMPVLRGHLKCIAVHFTVVLIYGAISILMFQHLAETECHEPSASYCTIKFLNLHQ